jgi:hypothetical protein
LEMKKNVNPSPQAVTSQKQHAVIKQADADRGSIITCSVSLGQGRVQDRPSLKIDTAESQGC